MHVYTPFKYFKGLRTKQEVKERLQDILKGRDSDMHQRSSYRPFKTDVGKKTKLSKYTVAFQTIYGKGLESLSEKSKATGVPVDILEKVFDKGRAAWRTGHRVGATPEQWGYARVHSFLTLGCTCFSSDFSLFSEALGRMKEEKKKEFLCKPILCPEKTLLTSYYKKRGAKEIIEQWRKSYFCK